MQVIYQKRRPEELEIGAFSLFPKTVSDSDVMMFCGETGDLSPIYLDARFAGNTSLEAQTVPPMLIASMLGGAVYRLLSPDAYPLKREFELLKPVHVGDTLTARAEITGVDKEKRQVTLLLEAYNSEKELVMKGTSLEQLVVRK